MIRKPVSDDNVQTAGVEASQGRKEPRGASLQVFGRFEALNPHKAAGKWLFSIGQQPALQSFDRAGVGFAGHDG